MQVKYVNHLIHLSQVFLSASYPITQASLEALVTYITYCDIPEGYICDTVAIKMGAYQLENCRYPLRAQLIDWLLKCNDTDEVTLHCYDAATIQLLAEALVTLCLRHPHKMKSRSSDCVDRGWLDKIQDTYMKVAFVKPDASVKSTSSPIVHDCGIISEVKKRLEQMLCKATTLITDVPSQQVRYMFT